MAAEAFANRQWRADLDEWDTVYKPRAIDRHVALAAVELGRLDDEGVATHLEEVGRHLSEMTYQHHRFNMAAMLPVGDFALHAAAWTGRDPASLLAVLDGYSPISAVASDELDAVLAALRADPELESLVRGGGDPAARLASLRERCPAVDAHVRSSGFRIIEGFDVVAPTQQERPALILGRYASALDVDPEEARRRADEFASTLRAEVPEEHQAEFDDLLGEARAVYRLRDERGIYSDISAVGLLRLAMLEAGRRLTAAGVLDDPSLALDATLTELTALLRGHEPAVTSAVLAKRQARRLALTLGGAPRYLGSPPPPPPPLDQLPPPLARVMAATGFVIEGVLGQLDAPQGDASVVRGVPVSAGVVEGVARVIRDVDELDRIGDGEILVTPATGEAFNAMLHLVQAIVTDHGSFACHAGIVSRRWASPPWWGRSTARAGSRTAPASASTGRPAR